MKINKNIQIGTIFFKNISSLEIFKINIVVEVLTKGKHILLLIIITIFLFFFKLF